MTSPAINHHRVDRSMSIPGSSFGAQIPWDAGSRSRRSARATRRFEKPPVSESDLSLDAYRHRLSCVVDAPELRIDDCMEVRNIEHSSF